MNRPFIRTLVFALLGGLAFLALQWQLSHAWTSYYSRFPWRGYEQAMREGHVAPVLTTSPRSLLIGRVVLLLFPLVALWFGAGRPITSTMALWGGVMVSVVAIWAATPQLRQDSNMWPIDLVFLAFCTGIPLLVGALVVIVIQKAGGFLLKR